MTPADLLRVGLEAAIVAQFAMVGVFQLATPPRTAPIKLLLVALAGAIALATLINALAAAGVLAVLRPLNIFFELSIGPVVLLLVLNLVEPRLRRSALAHLVAPAAGFFLALTVLRSHVDLLVLAISGAYVLATAVAWQNRPAAPRLSELATLLTAWLAAGWLLRLLVTVEAHSGGGYRAAWGYPVILGAALFLSSRMLYLCLRDPDVLGAIRRPAKYAGSALTPDDLATLEERLRRLLEEGVHRDSEISLERLADRLAATPREVSQLVNARFGEAFPALVNRLRVEDAARALADGDRPVTEIMLDVGFGSKSAFQREFRRRWAMSPTQYRQAARAGALGSGGA